MTPRFSSADLGVLLRPAHRLVWAHNPTTRQPEHLLIGTAEQQRAHTRQNLACPFPNCPAPDLTTAGSGKILDHYRHVAKNVSHPDPRALLDLQSVLAAQGLHPHPATVQYDGPHTLVSFTYPEPSRVLVLDSTTSPDACADAVHAHQEADTSALAWLLPVHHDHLTRKPAVRTRISTRLLLTGWQSLLNTGVPGALVNPVSNQIGVLHERDHGTPRALSRADLSCLVAAFPATLISTEPSLHSWLRSLLPAEPLPAPPPAGQVHRDQGPVGQVVLQRQDVWRSSQEYTAWTALPDSQRARLNGPSWYRLVRGEGEHIRALSYLRFVHGRVGQRLRFVDLFDLFTDHPDIQAATYEALNALVRSVLIEFREAGLISFKTQGHIPSSLRIFDDLSGLTARATAEEDTAHADPRASKS